MEVEYEDDTAGRIGVVLGGVCDMVVGKCAIAAKVATI